MYGDLEDDTELDGDEAENPERRFLIYKKMK